MGLLDPPASSSGYGRCITCLWAAASQASAMPQLECRRHAPFPTNQPHGAQHDPCWPWVEPQHRCGDYSQRPMP